MTTPASAGRVKRRSLYKLYTPASVRQGRRNVKTPQSKRVIASNIANCIEDSDIIEEGKCFKELLGKQWNIHSLSPLFNFKHSHEVFKRYARSLDMAFTQALGTAAASRDAEIKSSIDIYPGLKYHPDDHEAVRIQVTAKNPSDGKESVVLRAILLCVDMEKSIFPPEFCYFPAIIVSGNKTRETVLLEWLEQHFDCRTSLLMLKDSDLRWLLAVGCSQMSDTGKKKMDVLLQYDLSKMCSGINMMNCAFSFDFCQQLWNRVNDNAQSRDYVTEDEVKRFFTSLEHHIEHTMHIYTTKLALREVGSPMAYVSTKGKFKMFFHNSVYLTLHLICDTARQRYTRFYQM